MKISIATKDISEIIQLKKQAEQASKRLQYILDVSEEGIWEWNTQTQHVFHNNHWRRITGIEQSEDTFKEFQNCLLDEDRPRINQAITGLLEKNKPYNIEFRMKRPDGKVIWIWDRGQVVERDEEGKPILLVGIMQDITKAKEDHKRAEYLAFYDSLTGLPNRALMENRLTKAIYQAERKTLGLNTVSWTGSFEVANFDANNFGVQAGHWSNPVFDGTTTPTAISAVPEPSVVALMVGGLGLVGFMAARRRKQA